MILFAKKYQASQNINSLKEFVSRKYAKDLWAINVHYFMRSQSRTPLTPAEEEEFKMIREHLVQKYNSDIARFTVCETPPPQSSQ